MKRKALIVLLAALFVGTAAALAAWAQRVSSWEAEVQKLTMEHRKSSAELTNRARFHEKMENRFVSENPDQEMAAHCRHWAGIYRNLAGEEKKVAEELERKRLDVHARTGMHEPKVVEEKRRGILP